MRKSSIFIFTLLLTSVLVSPIWNSDADKAVFPFFDAWRPIDYATGVGCHTPGTQSIEVGGKVVFDTNMLVVNPGETFTLASWVEGFTGTVSSGDLMIGFNVLDDDNALFINETKADVGHKLTGGNSDAVYTETFTAPVAEGSYKLKAYAVSGDGGTSNDYFDYVFGETTIVVTNGIVGNGYIDSVVNHYDAIKDTSTTGYKWAETQKADELVYKPGMIKGAASIGNLMLEIYEERVRSSLFLGVNNEEIALPLDLAKGAGDWIVSIADSNASGTYWYKTYYVNDTASTSTVHLPYYEGVAGVASYLGRLYRITQDSTYLTTAENALTFLMNVANTSNSWYAWTEDFGQDLSDNLSTRWTKGSTGIGSVMLEFYRLTGDVAYKNAAVGIFKFLDDTKMDEAGNAYWYRYATDSASGVFVGRWHGVAGVASFLMDLYEVTGITAHKDLALSAMDYVVAHADDDGFGGYWFENAVTSGEYMSGWSRGGAGVGSMLIRAEKLNPAGNYIELLPKILTHYETFAIPAGDGWTFNDSINIDTPALSNGRVATAIGHGGAGIGMFFLEAYQATGNDDFRMAATKIGLGLKATAIDGLLWEKSTTEQYVDNYVYYGVGGVATFFLQYDLMGDKVSLDAATDATAFLLNFAETDGNGMKWAEKVGGDYKTGVLKGASGNALELMNIYQRYSTELLFGGLTTNATYSYLESAEKAMTWVDSVAVSLGGGKAWFEGYDASNAPSSSLNTIKTSYYPGAAGISDTFLRLSKMTGNSAYLTTAEAGATFLMNTANTTNGYAWPESYNDTINLRSTRWSFGSPGIGSFFLNLYQMTGNTAYGDIAKGVATFLEAKKVTADQGVKWYRYADDAVSGTYLGRWHGSAGISSFYMDLYQVFGDAAYKTSAIDSMSYVISQTNITGETASWENAVGSGEFISGWSRGGAGIADQLLRLSFIADNSTYMDYVKLALNWYVENVADVSVGWAWYDAINYKTPVTSNLRIASSLGHGAAGVIAMATEVFYFTRDPTAFKIMYKATEYLYDVATSNATGTFWLKSSSEQYFDTTLYYGTAGVAFALTEASSFFNHEPMISGTLSYDDSTDKVTGTFTLWEDIAVDNVKLFIDDDEVTGFNESALAVDEDVSSLAPGAHTIKVVVTDVGAKSAELKLDFTVPEPPTSTTPEPTTTTTSTSDEEGSPFPAFVFIISLIGVTTIFKRRRN